mmetsp:Transcript_6579/g.11745  ORF Transcript_6579/g.11745 Transcript_6579/m.11745 type:complete len:375 (-) Transcript_6579:184-1308(-)
MSEAVLTLTKARTELGASTLEQHIADALSFPRSKVTVIIDEGCATIIAYPEHDDVSLDADAIATKLNDDIQRGEAEAWAAGREATCEIADDEEIVFIDEEGALEMWREMSEETRTGHLDKVPNPDGVMIQPTHEAEYSTEKFASPTESQLKRDPSLLEYDNVKRVDVSHIHNISWEEPVIITNAITCEIFANRGIIDNHRLASVQGEVEVRTGNRETLIDNGITNSKPMPLSEALLVPQSGVENNSECGRIVFSPVKELPDDFAKELKPFTDCFPFCTESPIMKKFTLTLASEGFGIGMHKHNAAMFMLIIGRKKWYMSSSKDLECDSQTHPGFYREKSSHKCIQRQGEVLFVPNDWYHEIFNLEYTAGIQGLP